MPATVNPLSSPPPNKDGDELGDRGQWQKVPARRYKRSRCTCLVIPLLPQLPLQNRYTALRGQLYNGQGDGSSYLEVSPKSNQATRCIKTSPVKSKRQVIFIDDSLLKGAEGPICRPDPLHREVCCLPGARVKDVRNFLP